MQYLRHLGLVIDTYNNYYSEYSVFRPSNFLLKKNHVIPNLKERKTNKHTFVFIILIRILINILIRIRDS